MENYNWLKLCCWWMASAMLLTRIQSWQYNSHLCQCTFLYPAVFEAPPPHHPAVFFFFFFFPFTELEFLPLVNTTLSHENNRHFNTDSAAVLTIEFLSDFIWSALLSASELMQKEPQSCLNLLSLNFSSHHWQVGHAEKRYHNDNDNYTL